MQDGCAVAGGSRGSFHGCSPLEYSPDGAQAPGRLGTDQVSLSRYQWSLSTLGFLLIAYKILTSKTENRHMVKSNPSCDLTLPTEYCEKYHNLLYMGESE